MSVCSVCSVCPTRTVYMYCVWLILRLTTTNQNDYCWHVCPIAIRLSMNRESHARHTMYVLSVWECCGRPRESQGTEWPRLHSIRTYIVRIPQVQLLPTLRISSGLAFGNRRNFWRNKNRTPSCPNIVSPSNHKLAVAKTEYKQVHHNSN